MRPISFLVNILVTAIIVFATAYLLPGFEVESFWTALVVALVLGVLNAIVKPILTFLTFPIHLITLGLFSFVVSAVLLIVTAYIVPGFTINPYWIALPAAVLIAVFSAIASKLK